MLPPYIGPPLGLGLNVSSDLEVVDHVVPGAAVVLCGMLSALLARRAGGAQLKASALALTGLCFLGGLWQAATHAPLVLEGGTPEAPWGTVLLHSAAGPVIAALALWLTLRESADESAGVSRSS